MKSAPAVAEEKETLYKKSYSGRSFVLHSKSQSETVCTYVITISSP